MVLRNQQMCYCIKKSIIVSEKQRESFSDILQIVVRCSILCLFPIICSNGNKIQSTAYMELCDYNNHVINLKKIQTHSHVLRLD